MFAKKSPPFAISTLLFGTSVVAFFSFIFTVGSNDFFTPAHTNSFNVYGSLISHFGLVLAGGLFGLSIA